VIEIDVEQLSDPWFKMRVANPGGAGFSRIVTSTGDRVADSAWDSYQNELYNEYFIGRKQDTYHNQRMSEGNPAEAASWRNYELSTGNTLRKVGLIYRDERRLYHISPDAMIEGTNNGWETKDAQPNVQRARLKYFQKHKKLEPKFVQQCQGGIFICNSDYWDWQSYCSLSPKYHPPLQIRVYPDDKYLKKFEKNLEDFCNELMMNIAGAKNGHNSR